MNRFSSYLVVVLCFLVAPTTFAHQQKSSISTVLFNPRTHNIEVMHRFRVHDAEHAVKHIFGKDADILDAETTQAKFSEYVEQKFSLYDSHNKPLPLKVVGHEIEGQFFWVYQETKQPAKLENLKIRHDALRDLWPEQVNTINVEGKGDLQTLTFTNSVELLKVDFKH
ncbi:hypothetical protein L0668_03890 [Paraglaciecola aquimarina]|uniref:Orphan protein n=1 Tax=Paraglaciecola algarum TaxID=3050085 RepID=A0ABS9D485_9ALTE|nr:hypothetical protein [Paraglaciecola sp. G1-23]